MDGFAFDVEILFLARRAGLTIREAGIDWHYRQQSRVHPVRDSAAMTWDLLRVRWRSLRGRYEPRERRLRSGSAPAGGRRGVEGPDGRENPETEFRPKPPKWP
jgi:hypothetical protein